MAEAAPEAPAAAAKEEKRAWWGAEAGPRRWLNDVVPEDGLMRILDKLDLGLDGARMGALLLLAPRAPQFLACRDAAGLEVPSVHYTLLIDALDALSTTTPIPLPPSLAVVKKALMDLEA